MLNKYKQTVAAMAVITCATTTFAVPTMTLTDLATAETVVITDGSGLDIHPTSGIVTFAGRIGSWFLNVDTGLTKPTIGSASNPALDLSFVAVSKGAGGSLKITFSDDFFGPINGNVKLAIGGTTMGSVTGAAYYDLDNGIGGQASQIGSTLGAFSSGGFGSNQQTDLALGNPFSLTLEVIITHEASQLFKPFSSGDLLLQYGPKVVYNDPNPNLVPDGGVTLMLLGAGLACLGCWQRRVAKA